VSARALYVTDAVPIFSCIIADNLNCCDMLLSRGDGGLEYWATKNVLLLRRDPNTAFEEHYSSIGGDGRVGRIDPRRRRHPKVVLGSVGRFVEGGPPAYGDLIGNHADAFRASMSANKVRTRRVRKREEMAGHKFHVGQVVQICAAPHRPRSACKIMRLLPAERGEPEYEVRLAGEPYNRIAQERDLYEP
jgi:hypothetical protein